jgi:ABC-type amino acid transport substrate-binding protein
MPYKLPRSTRRKVVSYFLIILVVTLLSHLFFARKGEHRFEPRDYEAINKEKTLRAVMEYNAVSYHAEGDTIDGVYYRLIEAFARAQGWKVEVTPEMSFSKRMEGVMEGRYDLLADGVPVTTEMRGKLEFTNPIRLDKQVLVQRKETPNDTTHSAPHIRNLLELAGKTLYVVKGSPAIMRIRNLSNEIADTIYIKEIEKYGSEQLIDMVAYGDIDYAVCEEDIAAAAADSLPQIDIKTDIGFTQFYAWGVNKLSPVLLDSLNSWLSRQPAIGKPSNAYRR